MKTSAATNRLLASLSSGDRRRVYASGDVVELDAGVLLHEAGTRLLYVYFPVAGLIALVTPLDACAGLEVGLVGSEGMVGISSLLGVDVSPLHHLVQGQGAALRLTAVAFRKLCDSIPALHRRLDRYLYVTLQQFALTAACTRFHVVEARLARWLLMTHDRSQSDQFHATHVSLAYMLGVRRVGITKAATSLHKDSLIRYSRGDITILDRKGLQKRSCLCYAAANDLYARVLG